MPAPPIVLATDFGLTDGYVGMMRGVIADINPAASVIDLTHGIGAQDIRHGAVVLADSCGYFPRGSIFVAVVDPGVGTDRAAILLETPDYRFIAPDNGLLTLVCRRYAAAFGDTDFNADAGADTDGTAAGAVPPPAGCRAWRLTNPAYRRHPVSRTFHGRDVFAPAAAHLSLGAPPNALGEPAAEIIALPLSIPRWRNNALQGQVIYADAFGNLVTDITADTISSRGDAPLTVSIAGNDIAGLAGSFHEPPGPAGALRALLGSQGRLEIAVVDGSAAVVLGVGSGAAVTVNSYAQ